MINYPRSKFASASAVICAAAPAIQISLIPLLRRQRRVEEMHPFSLSAVKEVDLAIRAHARDPNTAFIAGGTDLVGLMKDRVVLPQHLVDINHLPGLDQIELLPDGGFRMGALVRMSDVAVNMHVRKS